MSWLFPFLVFSAVAGTGPLPFRGIDISTEKELVVPAKSKGYVVVFLSAECPCSHSHVQEMRQLSKDFPDFSFIAIHSNADEDQKSTKEYFNNNPLPFPILEDSHSKWADHFKAYKTPHAFILSNTGEVMYQGGVSSSKDFEKAEHKYLREALSQMTQGHEINPKQTRTLGCAIQRG